MADVAPQCNKSRRSVSYNPESTLCLANINARHDLSNMNSIYTTHLICAPQLDVPTIVGAILSEPGDFVEADDPLVLLHGAGLSLEVCALEAGIVGYFTVKVGELVATNDLLLTMEIEEKPFSFLPMVEEEPVFAPACQMYPAKNPVADTSKSLQVTSEAANLAARLGINLVDVKPGQNGIIDDEAIIHHVRDILVRWHKIQQLTR